MSYNRLETNGAAITSEPTRPEGPDPHRRVFDLTMRVVDVVVVASAILPTAVVAILLFFLNPAFNPGPVFFTQRRMGRGGRPFVIWKFRSMVEDSMGAVQRQPHDEIEHSRITRLGRLLRLSRVDELPNIINVCRGEMSIIGPRPDTWEHAVAYLQSVPNYDRRLSVRPGITGLAQVCCGYADTPVAIRRKARYDAYYVRHASPLLVLFILAQTIWVMGSGRGAK